MRRFLVPIVVVIIFFGIYLWWQHATSPVNPLDQTKRLFVIQKGEGIRVIADKLKSAGLINDPLAFLLFVKERGLDNKIQAGEFHLAPAMDAQEIAIALQVGTFDLQITIPEGKRAEEIADILQKSISGYQDSWRAQLNTNEGYLFPDTYSFTRDTTIDQVIQTMRDNFQRKYAEIANGSGSTTTLNDTVTIASLVAREAKYAEDRPLVASVIFNRLHLGMPLQIDATIQYALSYQMQEGTWWKKDLTESDLQIDSPYNSYTHTGLPPTPISNPGLADLQAVVQAPQTDYLFYISDKSGHNHFAKTLAEQNANIQKYGL